MTSLLLGGMKQNLQVVELDLAEIGPKFEHHEVFPARTNTGWNLFTLWKCFCYWKFGISWSLLMLNLDTTDRLFFYLSFMPSEF